MGIFRTGAVQSLLLAWGGSLLCSFVWLFTNTITLCLLMGCPNIGKNFAKLYSIFQKLDHLTCNKIPELV